MNLTRPCWWQVKVASSYGSVPSGKKKNLNHCWPDLCRYMVSPGHEFIEVGVEDKFVKALQQCTWWRHQMQTFPALLAICVRNSPVTGEFPAQRPATRSFGVFLDLSPNKRFSKQSWGWWFETPPRPLWRQCNSGRDREAERAIEKKEERDERVREKRIEGRGEREGRHTHCLYFVGQRMRIEWSFKREVFWYCCLRW